MYANAPLTHAVHDVDTAKQLADDLLTAAASSRRSAAAVSPFHRGEARLALTALLLAATATGSGATLADVDRVATRAAAGDLRALSGVEQLLADAGHVDLFAELHQAESGQQTSPQDAAAVWALVAAATSSARTATQRLADVADRGGARFLAHELLDAGPFQGDTDLTVYWQEQAAVVLTALLAAAAQGGHDVNQAYAWALSMSAGDTEPLDEVLAALKRSSNATTGAELNAWCRRTGAVPAEAASTWGVVCATLRRHAD